MNAFRTMPLVCASVLLIHCTSSPPSGGGPSGGSTTTTGSGPDPSAPTVYGELPPEGWTKTYQGAVDLGDFLEVTSLAVDGDGNILLAGLCDSINLGGPDVELFGTGVFVAKLDSQGQHVWTQAFVTEHVGVNLKPPKPYVTADPAGGVYLVGKMGDGNSFDLGGASLSLAYRSMFAVKLDAEGKYVWHKSWDTPFESDKSGPYTVAWDPAGRLVIGGAMRGEMTFASQPLGMAGRDSAFVAELGSDGTEVWAKAFGPATPLSDPNVTHGVTVLADGSLVVTGSLARDSGTTVEEGTTDFGGGPVVVPEGNSELFVKYAPDRQLAFAKQLDGGSPITALAKDAQDKIYLLGSAAAPFVTQLSSNGEEVWRREITPTYKFDFYAAAIAGSGQIFVSGNNEGGADLGAGMITGDTDATYGERFLATYDPAGALTAYALPGLRIPLLMTTPSGDVLVAGNDHNDRVVITLYDVP
ncbi:hypothetical protein [Polyangium aurulentum]|uniref:hypothetical protein n=1 Tax=Polyangium aurulentum TaxID=2567896 RepID=UPI0010AE967D|nr:hypothetical protein [Polyangium aurulentum]UQA58417.1 hypothetical protein E8A73_045430 [Polyangium aurulentum]